MSGREVELVQVVLLADRFYVRAVKIACDVNERLVVASAFVYGVLDPADQLVY